MPSKSVQDNRLTTPERGRAHHEGFHDVFFSCVPSLVQVMNGTCYDLIDTFLSALKGWKYPSE